MGKEEPSDFSARLAKITARFDNRGKSRSRTSTPRGWFVHDLEELFTRDVTSAGLRDLVRRDARETYRFLTSEVDVESLRTLPWFRRYPTICWKVFVALAYRLSPPRRIAFAIASFLGLIGMIQLIIFWMRYSGNEGGSWIVLLICSFALFFMLLLMELRDKLDLKGDLEIAREIQFGLVPSEPYHRDGISIHCYMRPANTVGGDYYDIIQIEEHRVGVVIGDVSGKGMPAALLMALLQGSLRTLSTAGLRGSELIAKLNRYLCANIPSNRLVTLFYGEIDPATGAMRYINAGHNAPFLMRGQGSPERLPSTSLVLGVDAGSCFEAAETRICPGDLLLLFTDGVTEAFNAKDEEYGEERLACFLRQRANLQATELIKAIVDDVLRFCDSTWPKDDITLVAITRQ
jgi:phosphoserine phosphatase RsbU/P